MTPARKTKIQNMLTALDINPRAYAFEACGGVIIAAPQTNTARYAGVSSTCTWNKDQHLIEGWMRIARRQLRRADGAEVGDAD